MQLNELLRTRREALNLSQADVAKAIGVSRQAVGLWEDGTTGPRRKYVKALARVLKLKPGAIDPLLSDDPIAIDSTTAGVTVPLLHLEDVVTGEAMNRGVITGPSITIDPDLPSSCFGLIVADESMVPDYAPSDIVIVQPGLEPMCGDDVVARLPDGPAVIRRFRDRGEDKTGFRVFDLFSTDPNFITITVNLDNRVNILGVIIEHRRKRLRR